MSSVLIKKIEQKLKYKKLWLFKYILQKNNQVVDEITKLTARIKKGVQIFKEILKKIL